MNNYAGFESQQRLFEIPLPPLPDTGGTNFEIRLHPLPIGQGETFDVSIDIFTLGGRKIMQIEQEYFSVGFHTIDWDGKDAFGDKLANGVYLYRLKAVGDGETASFIGRLAKYE